MTRRRSAPPPSAYDLGVYEEKGRINAVIEATRGTRNKYKYDAATRLFRLNRVLPSGSSFPLDYGFIPGTRGEDGDPLDVLVFSDDPLAVGTIVPSRLIGILEAEQTEEGKPIRNDRLVAAAAADGAELELLKSLKDLPKRKLEAFKSFFVSYNAQRGVRFEILDMKGPEAALRILERGEQQYRRKSKGR